jgi:hypothetical protein
MCQTAPREASNRIRPRWGLLYGSTLSPLAALAVVEAASPPSVVRTLFRCVLVLSSVTAMAIWVRCSRTALDLQAWCTCAPDTIRTRIVESRRPTAPAPIEPIAPAPAPPEKVPELVS